MAGDRPPQDRSSLFPLGWGQRLWFGYVTVVVPAGAFALSANGLRLVDWQRKDLSAWAELLLDRPGTLAFLPLAGLVMATCLALVVRPGSWAAAPPVRVVLGIGALLAVQYSILVACALFLGGPSHASLTWAGAARVVLPVLGVEAVSVAAFALGRAVRRRTSGPWFWGGLAFVLANAWVVAAAHWLDRDVFQESPPRALIQFIGIPGGVVLVASLLAGPVWAADALVRANLRLGRLASGQLAWGLPALGAYALSWRFALLEVIAAYEALPDSPPDCFVATAAAHGPPRLVGSRPVRPRGGAPFRVTLQLQRLKAFELTLRCAAPRAHRRLRSAYDRLGPPLAAAVRGPLGAACAWLALKPFEWTAVAVTRLLGGREAARRTARLYRGSSPAVEPGEPGRG